MNGKNPTHSDGGEREWPCDFPTPHSGHVAPASDDLGILIAYTEWCHGGAGPMTTPTPVTAEAETTAGERFRETTTGGRDD